ncbi:MAG: glycosyltransferase family protein [Nanoarchaeota archaeon]
MKYLFVITGIGLGHTIREDAIIKELLKLDKDAEIRIASYGNTLKYFAKKFPLTEIIGQKFPDVTSKIESFKVIASNLTYPYYYLQNIKKLKRLIKNFQPDVVIVDAQPEGIVAAKSMKVKSIFIYNLDLNELLFEKKFRLDMFIHKKAIEYCHKNADKVIIPILTQKTKVEDNINYINPIVRETPGRLPIEIALTQKFNFKKHPVLLTIGGSKFGLNLVRNIINASNYFDEDFIVFGVDLKIKKANVTCLPFQKNFLEYLKVAKAIITLAGHSTLSEILHYKKPALVFPIPNYIEQYQNAHLMQNYSLIGDMEELSLVYTRNILEKFFKNLEKLEHRLKELNIHKNGAEEAAKIILQEASK